MAKAEDSITRTLSALHYPPDITITLRPDRKRIVLTQGALDPDAGHGVWIDVRDVHFVAEQMKQLVVTEAAAQLGEEG